MATLYDRFADKLAARDGGHVCRYCGVKIVRRPYESHPEDCYHTGYGVAPADGYAFGQIDHVIPKSRGGSNKIDNLVLACGKCNASKNARTPEEWAVRDE
jgi:hypothetical protein